MNAPRGCAAANAAGYETLLTKHDCEMQIERERWFSLPKSSSHLPQGRQRMWERPPGREEAIVRPLRMTIPARIRQGWRGEDVNLDVTAKAGYTWSIIRWRAAESSLARLWRALIAWVER